MSEGADIFGTVIKNVGNLAKTGVRGIRTGTDVVSDAADDATNLASETYGDEESDIKKHRKKNLKVSHLFGDDSENKDEYDKKLEKRKLKRKEVKKKLLKSNNDEENNYQESAGDDRIQGKHKAGYCYIGSDRGYRSCIKVGENDGCESGKIFPTMDVCINPRLRV